MRSSAELNTLLLLSRLGLRYWYKDFFLFPHMQTIWVALDHTSAANGVFMLVADCCGPRSRGMLFLCRYRSLAIVVARIAVRGSFMSCILMRVPGCLKVMRRSNQMGRIDHFVVGGQQVADAQRVEQLQHHPLGGVVDCVMSPGDAVFVHGTTLHMSEGNLSDQRRLAFAAHFTRAHNQQFVDPFATGLVRIAWPQCC